MKSILAQIVSILNCVSIPLTENAMMGMMNYKWKFDNKRIIFPRMEWRGCVCVCVWGGGGAGGGRGR